MVKTKNVIIIIAVILILATMVFALFYFNFTLYKNSKESAVEKLEADNSDLQSEVEELRTELKKVKNDLNKAESNLKIVNARIKTAENSLANKEAELKNAQSALTNARTDAIYWKDKYLSKDPDNVTYSYEFSSVNALLTAIKKNPEAYHNKQVKIFGMILTYEHETFNRKEIVLIDYKGETLPDNDGYQARYLKRNKIEAKQAIEVTMLNDLQYTVAETGDYVNLYGTVKITNGEIYLDKCQYN